MVNAHPLALVKSIVDPIHGLVRMTMEEHHVMDHRVFQRLRRVKQNGLLHLVFPSATHSRFEHSLGVMFVADSVLQALLFNSQANDDKLHPLAGAAAGQAVRLTDLAQDEAASLFRVTRLAALVHDLGHGPLSHSFDEFAPSRAAIRRLLEAPELTALAPLRDILVRYPRRKELPEHRPIAHEATSCILFACLWHDLRARKRVHDDWLPLAVAGAILGPEAEGALAGLPPGLQRLLPLVSDIIASAPVDADRMDYMERDSRSCGVSYGLFDRNRILKSALCFRDPRRDVLRLGWKLSGLRTIEVFLQARFQLYAQIYNHKTNSAANLMLERIAAHFREQTLSLFAPDLDLAGLVQTYCELGDEQLLHRLGDASQPPEVRALAGALDRRDLWKRIYESTEGLSARHMKKLLLQQISHPATAAALEVRITPLDATRGLETGASLLARREDNLYGAVRERTWLQHSPLLRALADDKQRIERLYWTGPHDALERLGLARRARELAGEPAAEAPAD